MTVPSSARLQGLAEIEGRVPCSECGKPFWKDGNTLTCGPTCSTERQRRLRKKTQGTIQCCGVSNSPIPEGWRCPCCQEAAAPGRWFCSDYCYDAFKDTVIARIGQTMLEARCSR